MRMEVHSTMSSSRLMVKMIPLSLALVLSTYLILVLGLEVGSKMKAMLNQTYKPQFGLPLTRVCRRGVS